jgi:CheY-like chemotaxis protein
MSIASYATPISSSAQRTANDELPVIWKNSIRGTYHPLVPDRILAVSHALPYATQRIVSQKEPPLMPLLAPPKRKILTVEDNAIVSADVRTILEAAGYDVVPDARDGLQAVEHVRAYAPDLILLDLALPRVDGVEAASLIREESDAPIVVLTSSSDPERLERATAAGTSGLVRKPFSAQGQLAAVGSRLTSREPDDFGLRCLIEEMVREGADEREIVRALRARAGSDESAAGSGERRSLWQVLPFVGRRAQDRAAA